jgi:hypothetical protein
MKPQLGIGVLLAVVAAASSARAEEQMLFRYEKTDEGQPDARAATEILRRRIKTISASAGEAGETAGVIRLETRANECVAFAELKTPFEGERVLRAPTCEQALEALGVALSVLINETTAPPPRAEEAPPPEPPAVPKEEETPKAPPKARVGVGMRGGLDRGYIPNPGWTIGGPAIELFVRYEFTPRWEIELGWHKQLEDGYVRTSSGTPTYATVAGDAATWAFSGRLCRLSAGAEVALLIRGCARVEVIEQTFGREPDQPQGPYNSTSTGHYGGHVWPVVGLEGGVRLSGAKQRPGPYVEASVAVTAALLRPRWVTNDGLEVYRPDLFQISTSIGAGWRF